MKFLIDTNVFLPLEPASSADVEENTSVAAELVRLCSEAEANVYLHRATRIDISRDECLDRRRMREQLLEKYPHIPEPPLISSQMEEIIGKAEIGSNDWVDDSLLAAVYGDAADYLVSEDTGVHRKARRLGIAERVATVGEAVSIVRRLFDLSPLPPPAVQSVLAHELSEHDPIFSSLRTDYAPHFDNWLRKCKRKHRKAWVVRPTDSGPLAGVCIVKEEEPIEAGLSGKVLKMCTFKVSDDFRGNRYGELLLKAVFDYACTNRYDWAYLTVFPAHDYLIDFLADFGFERTGTTNRRGEELLAKPLCPGRSSGLDPLPFHVRFGPPALRLDGVGKFIVPIRPGYVGMLFPEVPNQLSLFPGQDAFGNGIRKAYLCNAGIRTMCPGDVLLFYQSQSDRGIKVVGVVERTFVSQDPSAVSSLVGKRTVYSFREIEKMCRKETLAILFRQAHILGSPITYNELDEARVLTAAPQSIQTFPEEHSEWLKQRLSV